ncbi:MAG: hypothetical protein HUJ79_03220, partial [Firmicutes bacterium]|nr:hypothetical protein [Bacillota bacterium]
MFKVIVSILIIAGLAALYAFALSKNGSTPACDHDCKSCMSREGCSIAKLGENDET